MINAEKLKKAIALQNTTLGSVADSIGINRVTFYRKLISGDFLLREVNQIVHLLCLSTETALEIFFDWRCGEI